jgi:hypothetical protein
VASVVVSMAAASMVAAAFMAVAVSMAVVVSMAAAAEAIASSHIARPHRPRAVTGMLALAGRAQTGRQLERPAANARTEILCVRSARPT